MNLAPGFRQWAVDTHGTMRRSRLFPCLWLGLASCFLPGCSKEPEATSSTPQPQILRTAPEVAETPAQMPLQAPAPVAPPSLQSSKLPLYELQIAPKDLQTLEQSAFSNETVPGTFLADGDKYEGVRIRHRGAWARSWPKKPLKIFFQKEKRYQGQRCLNLNSAWHDPALVRECLAYQVFAACGSPAPESRMVRVNVNGRFGGVYVQVEQPDQRFAKRLNFKGAAVYKAGQGRSNQADERDLSSDAVYRRNYEKQTRKEEGYEDLQQFCHGLAQSPNAADFFGQNVDVEKYINYLCATVLIQNWDGFNKNHYLVHDVEGSHKWFAVPWDLDRTFGDHWDWRFDEARLPIFLGMRRAPGVTGWNRMQDRFMTDPGLRGRFLDRLEELLKTEFTEAKLYPLLDQLEAIIARDAVLDRQHWPGQNDDLHGGIAQVKQFIRDRRAYLTREIPRLRTNFK